MNPVFATSMEDEEKYLTGLDIVLDYLTFGNSVPDLVYVANAASRWAAAHPLFHRRHLRTVLGVHPRLFDTQTPSWDRAATARRGGSSPASSSGWSPAREWQEDARMAEYSGRVLAAYGLDPERRQTARAAACLWRSPIRYHIPEVVHAIACLGCGEETWRWLLGEVMDEDGDENEDGDEDGDEDENEDENEDEEEDEEEDDPTAKMAIDVAVAMSIGELVEDLVAEDAPTSPSLYPFAV